MAEELSPTEFVQFVSTLDDKIAQAWSRALLRVMPQAELDAKKNVKTNFTGRRGYRLTGRLLNSIRHRFERQSGSDYADGVLESKGVPYNAIHENDGVTKIKPKKANNLWIKNHEVPNKYRTMTPREFMGKMLAQGSGDPERFAILRSQAGKLAAQAFVNGQYEATLFFLRKEVDIKGRPYMAPAIKKASQKLDTVFLTEVEKAAQ